MPASNGCHLLRPICSKIAALCTRAEKIATKTVNEELKVAPDKGQVALSKTVRNALADAGVAAAMDACARELLPDHAE